MEKKLTEKQIEDDAYTLQNYITVESLNNELQDCEDVKASGDGYASLDDVIAVLKKAIKIGSNY